jgi:biopolymer transport protein ExbD
MRIHDPFAEGEEPYNLIPLTDMVFNLLIFFMCATTFVQVEKDMALQLPKIGHNAALAASAVTELVINIRQDGTTLIAGKAYDEKALAQRVAQAVGTRTDQVVVIRADERSIVRYFADVARICKQAGVKEARLVYLESAGR